MPRSRDSSICSGCQCELRFDDDSWYVVQIRACANTVCNLDGGASREELEREIQRLSREVESYSAQELLDQEARIFTIHLCAGCYARWIDDPAAGLHRDDGKQER